MYICADFKYTLLTYLLTYLDDKYMRPTKFQFIWLSGLRGEDFFKSTNKKQLWIQLSYDVETAETPISRTPLIQYTMLNSNHKRETIQ